ncbi:MAG: alpha/beta hydrolase [Gemmatimonadaceae bacterium]|nr:alpha/beta hydrolase [Gemmatimonadaceae bacterium]
MLKTLIVVPLALTGVLVGSAARSHAERIDATVRNIVLVHGAYADGSSYARVIPLLRAKGFHVTAVQNPLTSLAADVAATKRAIARIGGPVILVGHSSAGVVITEAGNDPRVAGLVYISAIAPDDGQSASDALKGYPATPGGAEQHPDAAGYLTITRKGVDEDFVPDLAPADRALVFETQGDWNSTFLTEKVTRAAWRTKPSWFIIPDDRMVPVQHERDAAARMRAKVTTLAASHVPMLSHPNDVAAVIMDAAANAPARATATAGTR